MANIKCKSCGRRYSYLESDLCPHCGAYNRPPSRMRVDFDKDGNAELLNEKQFQRQSAANRQQKDCYEHETAHESGKAVVRPSSGLTTGKLVAVAAVLVAVFIAVCGLNFFIGTSEGSLSPDIEIVPEAPAEEIVCDPIFDDYDLGEQFMIDGQPVTVHTAYVANGQLLVVVQGDGDLVPDLSIQDFTEQEEIWRFVESQEPLEDGLWLLTYDVSDINRDSVDEVFLLFWDAENEIRVYMTSELLDT